MLPDIFPSSPSILSILALSIFPSSKTFRTPHKSIIIDLFFHFSPRPSPLILTYYRLVILFYFSPPQKNYWRNQLSPLLFSTPFTAIGRQPLLGHKITRWSPQSRHRPLQTWGSKYLLVSFLVVLAFTQPKGTHMIRSTFVSASGQSGCVGDFDDFGDRFQRHHVWDCDRQFADHFDPRLKPDNRDE